MPKPKSQAQARFFGAIAGGRGGKAATARRKGFGRLKARDSLRGVEVKVLPPIYRDVKRTPRRKS
jgi:hypothetical protein